MTKPFAGVRIVELAQYVFVPGAGVMLADLGAEVIHVEGIEGDPYRSMKLNDGRNVGTVNLAMEQNNRNKKSLAVDLKTPEGREVFLRLIETADVFMTSVRPQAIERLGIGVDALRARNPQLIYARGNGLGFRGEEAGRPGLDMASFWARGGFASVYTPADADTLTRARGALGDHSASLSFAFGVAAALFRRANTGEPSVVESSLLSTAMWILSADIVAALNNPDYRQENFAELSHEFPLLRAYKTRDNRWLQLVMMESQRFWPQVCALLGVPELATDPRFVDIEARARNGAECVAILAGIIARRDWAEWQPVFARLDGPWELVRTIDEVSDDPQAHANGYFVEADCDGNAVRMIGGPVTFDGTPVIAACPSPSLGEHSEEILRELAFDPAEIAALRTRAIVSNGTAW